MSVRGVVSSGANSVMRRLDVWGKGGARVGKGGKGWAGRSGMEGLE